MVLTLGAASPADIDLGWSVEFVDGRPRGLPRSVPAEAGFLCALSNDLLVATVSSLPGRQTALSTLVSTETGLATEAQPLVLVGMPTAALVASESLVIAGKALLDIVANRPGAAAAYLDLVLSRYQYRLRAGAPLDDITLLRRVVANPYVEPRHVVWAVECALGEWARLTRTDADEEDLRAFIRSAARWLDSRPQGDLTELWVTVVESGFPAPDVSPRLADVERAVRASAGDLPHSQVSAVRLRRALRLGAGR